MKNDYTYAVARIKARETTLLSKNDMDTLLSCRTLEDCLHYLYDKGWKECKNSDIEQVLFDEEDGLWNFINELTDNDGAFDVFRYPVDFHNVKASVKAVAGGIKNPERFFMNRGNVNADKIYNAVKEKDFDALPPYLSECADKALHALIQTSDGQLCDIMIDRKSLEYIIEAASKSKCDLLKVYAELTVAASDIKISVRCLKTGKSLDFIKLALAPCRSLNVSSLAEAASKTFDAICEYLTYTDYSESVEYLKKSSSEFEKYCDNLMMKKLQEQKSNYFTVAPIAAYFLAKQQELKSVRIILSGKQNSLDDLIIKERLRDVYV